MLRGQDILVLLKLANRKEAWTYAGLADELGLSASETHAALRRAAEAGLYAPESRRVWVHALWEFAVYGLRYVFPAKPQGRGWGIPTAHSAKPLCDIVTQDNDEDVFVWPHAKGTVVGGSLQPLHPSAPDAALRDPRLYRLLALVDTLRAGGVRDRNVARRELKLEFGF